VSVSDTHRFYYLHNFHQALAWLTQRYDDVLRPEEHAFISRFGELPEAARALFVRMIMRKGPLFRTSKLQYDEIGCPLAAARPLVACGWVDDDPVLALDDVLDVLTRQEAMAAFRDSLGTITRKRDMAATLLAQNAEPRRYRQWWTQAHDGVLSVQATALCERLRAIFFGNLRQPWSTFVLADLGVHRYESVALGPQARAFDRPADVDHFFTLHACREALEQGAVTLDSLLACLDDLPPLNDWLARRAARIRFLLGQCAERQQDWPLALRCYDSSTYPGARLRLVRVLERSGDVARALTHAQTALGAAQSEEERQCLTRMLPRLQRLGGAAGRPARAPALAGAVPTSTITLDPLDGTLSVERLVQAHLHREDAPVFYVENTLVNALFGLLCWDVVFAAVPGAFFHPFQSGPADLLSPSFRLPRAELIAAALSELDTGTWRDTIRARYAEKHGIFSPFVSWRALTPELLEWALQCVAPQHLRAWFERLLSDIKANRTGWPDLIQFFPDQSRYEWIEVKGPGDRLQDNQRRWLDFCMRHDMAVRVVHVTWARA